MRSTGMIASIAVAVLATGACGKPTFLASRAEVPVKVTVSCTEYAVDIAVAPFIVELDTGEVVKWYLESNQVESIKIEKKHSWHGWPYEDKPPIDVPKNGGKGSGRQKKDAKQNDPYPYNIEGSCTFTDGTSTKKRKFVIDPEMIIIPR